MKSESQPLGFVEQLFLSTMNKCVEMVCGVFRNLRGIALLLLSSVGLTTKLVGIGVANRLSVLLGVVGVIALSI